MPANTAPIYGRTSDIQIAGAVIGKDANTATDGTGANISLVYTSATSEGSYVQSIRFKPISTVFATVIRIWYCAAAGSFTPGTTNTAANTTLLGEISAAAFTASNTAASPAYEFALNLPMPADTKILVSFGASTGLATTGYNPIVIAMKY
jgi:hypothetical protein